MSVVSPTPPLASRTVGRALSLSRLLLPIGFFGYAAWVNLPLLVGLAQGDGPSLEGSVIRGEVMERMTEDYAQAMPHRDVAEDWFGAARFLLVDEGREGVVIGEDGWLFTAEELTPADEADVARLVEEALTAQAQLAEQGTRLVVIPLPAKLDIHREHGPSEAASEASAERHAALVAALEAAGVAVADPREALLAQAGRGGAFLARDTHWTPDGASAVAEAVAASGLVSSGDMGFVRREAEPKAVAGDLVSFVTGYAMAERLGLGPETVTPFVAEPVAAAGAGIFAAATPAFDTILVGTSYSADARWSFASALSLALGRDVLNLAEQGLGPVAPLRALLADASWTASPPDYVLWELPTRYLGDPSIWPDDPDGTPVAPKPGSHHP